MSSWDKTVAQINGPAALAPTSAHAGARAVSPPAPDSRNDAAPFVFPDSSNPSDRLKGAPAKKFRVLIEARNSARASLNQLTDRQNLQQQARFESERSLANIVRLHRMSADSAHPALEQLRARIAQAEQELENLQPFGESRTAVAASVGGLVANIERWISNLAQGIAIAAYDGPPPGKLSKSAPAQIVERCRGEIIGLRQEYQRVAASPLPAAEAKLLMRERIAARASVPDVFGLFAKSAFDNSQEINWPIASANMRGAGENLHATVDDTLGVLCWLDPSKLIAKLEAEIDLRADDTNSLTDKVRVERLAQLAAEILEIERTEEAAIEAAELSGLTIFRRRDADPRAVLCLSSGLPEPEVL